MPGNGLILNKINGDKAEEYAVVRMGGKHHERTVHIVGRIEDGRGGIFDPIGLIAHACQTVRHVLGVITVLQDRINTLMGRRGRHASCDKVIG